MKIKTFIAGLIVMTSMGCASTTHYEKRIFSWENKDATTLLKTWGQPDVIEKQANGDRIFLYTRLRHEPYSFAESDRVIATKSAATRKTASDTPVSSTISSNEIYLKCSTYFEIDKQEKVTSVEYRGDDCKWRN